MATLLAVVSGLSDALQHRPLVAVPLLFGAGLVTSLNPCIYPMIPITAGTLAGVDAQGRSRRRTVALTLTYVTGLALFYAILGLIAGLTGSLFGTIGSSPWARLAIGNVLVVFGLAKTRCWALERHWRLLRAISREGLIEHVTLLGKQPGPDDEHLQRRRHHQPEPVRAALHL